MPSALQHTTLEPETRWFQITELWTIALPTIAQMMSYTVMHFADTWMLARLGVKEPAAAGNAGIFAFSIIGFGVGVLFCVNTLVSQNYGQKDYKSCGQYLWQGIWFSVLFSALTAPLILPAARVFELFGHDPQVVQMEATFFRIAVAGTVIKLTGTACGQFLLAINRPWMVMVAAAIGVTVNIVWNWFFIFGNAGAPKMGVAGAAWGTNVGVTAELLVLAALAFAPSVRCTFNSIDWRLRWKQMKTLLGIGLSSGLQLVTDVLAWALFCVWVMGKFDTPAMAATIFMFRFLSVSFMPAFGMSTAVTALVGRYVGAGEPGKAAQRTHLAFVITLIYMLSCGAAYIIFRDQFMGIFSKDPEVLRVGRILMVFAGLYQLCDGLFIIYNGGLRGAGDTFVPAIATAVLCWSMTVFGGYYVATRYNHFGPTGPWIVATVYGLILGLFICVRFARGKWREIRLEEDSPAVSKLNEASATLAAE
jgi:MATE family multidrug resistance protein